MSPSRRVLRHAAAEHQARRHRKASNKREYGPAALLPETCAGLYRDMSPSSQVWMSHSDTVDHLAEGCRVIARNAEGVPVSLNGEKPPSASNFIRK